MEIYAFVLGDSKPKFEKQDNIKELSKLNKDELDDLIKLYRAQQKGQTSKTVLSVSQSTESSDNDDGDDTNFFSSGGVLSTKGEGNNNTTMPLPKHTNLYRRAASQSTGAPVMEAMDEEEKESDKSEA